MTIGIHKILTRQDFLSVIISNLDIMSAGVKASIKTGRTVWLVQKMTPFYCDEAF